MTLKQKMRKEKESMKSTETVIKKVKFLIRFSKWLRLLRAVVLILRCFEKKKVFL